MTAEERFNEIKCVMEDIISEVERGKLDYDQAILQMECEFPTYAVGNDSPQPLSKYDLVCEYVDSTMETIGDFTVEETNIDNIHFIQPLTPLCQDEFDQLVQAVDDATKGQKDVSYILIPYNVKALKLKRANI